MRDLFFVLIGDRFLCEEKRKEILTAFQKEFGPDLAVTMRRAGEVPVKNLLSEARVLPFLSPAQIFCIRDVESFTQDEIALWGEYLKSPHPKTFLLFEAESLEKTHPFLEWAGKARQVYFLQAQSEKIVARFIQEKIKQAGKKMTRQTQELLEARVGDSVSLLDTLLEQLILYVGSKEEIDPEAIERLDEKLESFEGDDLLQAIAQRNFTQALAVLNDLLELNFRDFPAVLGLLHWQFRRFWEAKRWQAEGASDREISFRLRLSPARTSHFFRELSGFTQEKLEKILEGLFRLDWELKSGRAEGRYEIERWLANSIS